MSSSKLRLSEIFSSVQGEGQWIGVPSVFVRLSGCNMRCVWCDTPYASWEPEGPFVTVDELVDLVTAYGVKHVVITGGEPMLFEPTVELVDRLSGTGHVITIETAGTVFRELPAHLMSISPKLLNSAPPEDSGWRKRHERTRMNRSALKKLVEHYPFQLKFVVQPEREAEMDEIFEILSDLGDLPPERIFLMAEGTDRETLLVRERALVPISLRTGFRIAPRLHIDLFGDTKGT